MPVHTHAHLDEYAIERAIVHWYAGPLDVLDGFIRLGAYCTVGAELTLGSFSPGNSRVRL